MIVRWLGAFNRNPFVNQVNSYKTEDATIFSCRIIESQSLRKSGQFLRREMITIIIGVIVGRNPFVNQVNFYVDKKRKVLRENFGRNPFVNQVNSYQEVFS